MNTRGLIVRFLILFFLGLLVYFNSFSNKFLIDDYAFLANPTTNTTKFLLLQFSPYQQFDAYHDPQEWSSLTYYRPLAHIVPAICYAVFGKHYWQYHLFNLVLFIIASFLIYLCVLQVSKSDPLAFLASAFYIVHPINGVVVNYITASVFAIQVIFITASILCLWESIERRDNRVLYYSSLLFMVLALLCHETSVMVPFYIGTVLVIAKSLDPKRVIKCLIPYFLILLVYLLFRTYYVSLNDLVLQKMITFKMNFFEYTATLFTIITWYIGQLFFPDGIVLVWATPVVRTDLFWGNLGLAALVFFFIAAFIIFYQQRLARIGLVWFLIGFLPMAVAPFSRPYDGVDIEPHWFVFSVIGFFIVIAHSFLSVSSKIAESKKWIAGILLFLVVISWVNISHHYNRLWSNERTYTRYWLSQLPQLKSVHAYLGNAYRLEGNWKEARKNYLLGLTGGAGDVAIYMDLGSIEKRSGHFKEAEAYYQECLKMFPSAFVNYANLGSLYLMYGKLDQAKAYYEKALMYNPNEAQLLEALISISLRKNDITGFKKYAYRYLEKEEDPQSLMRFGDAMLKDRFFDIAFKAYGKAGDNTSSYEQVQELLSKEKEFSQILHARP